MDLFRYIFSAHVENKKPWGACNIDAYMWMFWREKWDFHFFFFVRTYELGLLRSDSDRHEKKKKNETKRKLKSEAIGFDMESKRHDE